jgi:hypothetical protein
MTLEKLLNATADELDAIPPEELNKYFEQFFPTTRPELARKTVTDTKNSGGTYTKREKSQLELPRLSSEQQQHLAKLASLGIDISFASHPQKKRR